MGRKERPLDPADGPVAGFACELRRLRAEAGGITYRELARRTHFATATLAQAAAGDRLPSLPVALAYAEACGGDRAEWERRWYEAEAARTEAAAVHARTEPAPYQGLARYEPGDRDRFFGRDRVADRLVAAVAARRLTLLVGPSGSGKSSLLRAGLIPRLRETGPGAGYRPASIRVLTPGAHPGRVPGLTAPAPDGPGDTGPVGAQAGPGREQGPGPVPMSSNGDPRVPGPADSAPGTGAVSARVGDTGAVGTAEGMGSTGSGGGRRGTAPTGPGAAGPAAATGTGGRAAATVPASGRTAAGPVITPVRGVAAPPATESATPRHPAAQASPADAPERKRREAGDGPLLVVDQFEEIFTLCADPVERALFIDRLLAWSERPGARVLIAVRADFYPHCARYRPLAEAAAEHTLPLPPMTPDELRAAITGPAARAGLLVERGLTARVLDEIADEPGGLPLMSHALLETWHRRRGRTLTEAAYTAAGGLSGAIAGTAEELYAELTPRQRAVARLLLLRLVAPAPDSADGSRDTRRPASRAELTAADLGESAAVLERLARARLLTLDTPAADEGTHRSERRDERGGGGGRAGSGTPGGSPADTVQLAHESLLTAWPRLRRWIDEDRDRLRLRRDLATAADVWHGLGRDPGALYRGVRLAAVAESFGDARSRPGELTPGEAAFLTASLTARTRVRRRSRLRLAVLCALLATALVAGLVTLQQRQDAERRRIEDEARRVAGVAESLRRSDPVTAMRLGLAARRIADTPETRSALLGAAAQPDTAAFTDPESGDGVVRHLGADGTTLTSVGARAVVVIDVASGRRLRTLPGLGDDLSRVSAPRADAEWLPQFATGPGGERTVRIRDLARGTFRGPAHPADGGAEQGPGGRTLITYETVPDPARPEGAARTGGPAGAGPATGTEDIARPGRRTGGTTASGRTEAPPRQRAVVRDAEDGTVLLALPPVPAPRPPDGAFPAATDLFDQELRLGREGRALGPTAQDVTLDPTGRLLARCLPGAPLELWDMSTGRRRPLARAPEATAAQCARETVAFTPDGRTLAVADDDRIRLWDTSTGAERPAVPHPGADEIRFGADGTFLAVADPEAVSVFRLARPNRPVLRRPLYGERASQLRFGPGGRLGYLSGSGDDWAATVRTVDAAPVLMARGWRAGATTATAFSPDGRLYATATTGPAAASASGAAPSASGAAPGSTAGSGHGSASGSGVASGGGPGLPPESGAGPEAGPDGAGERATVRITVHDLRTGERYEPPALPCLTTAVPRNPSCPAFVAFRPDGGTLAYGVREPEGPDTRSRRVRFWDTARHTVTTATAGPVLAPLSWGQVTYAPDGRALLVPGTGPRGEDTLHLWDPARPAPRAALPGGAGGFALAVAPDGRRLADSTGNGRRLPSGTPLPGARDIGSGVLPVFSPDGGLLAAGDVFGRVTLWDGGLRRRLGELVATGSATAVASVTALAFSPDARTLAVGSGDGTLTLWDVATRRPVGLPLPTPGDAVVDLRFGPGGTVLYAGGDRVPLRAYPISTAASAAEVCRRAGGPLTRAEWRRLIPGAPYRDICAGTSRAAAGD
ncbi:hypothetical protein AB0G74_21880 [Streptomyces sp. NPDC020875]|uniref:nSTAND1 domain-containing NTPase n=1 Tax=Streptomyces sp. NPDC020875 TaxID=3154898 RepID=UPI0033FB5FDF